MASDAFRNVKALLLFIAVAGCVKPPAPNAPGPVTIGTDLAAPQRQIVVSWSPSITPGVLYQVWETTNLSIPFAMVQLASNLSWTDAVDSAAYVRVRAVNSNGIVSAWAKSIY